MDEITKKDLNDAELEAIFAEDESCLPDSTGLGIRAGWRMHFDVVLDVNVDGANTRIYGCFKRNSKIGELFYDDMFIGPVTDRLLFKYLYTKTDGKGIEEAKSILCDLLTKFGIYSNLKGYKYLIAAFCEAYRNSELLKGRIMSGLYPAVAARFGTNAFCVEKNIRLVIENSVIKEKFYVVANKELGGNFSKYDKLPNGEFIAFLVDRITKIISERKE